MRHAVDVGARTVSYRRQGDGPAVVLVGALTHSTAPEAALIDLLAASHTVIAVDPPGQGFSDPLPAGADDVAAVAGALAATLSAVGVGAAAVVGRGTGGTVALELARREPDRFGLLVLDDVPLLDEPTRRRWAAEAGRPVEPQRDGSHLIRHWYRRRQAFVTVPWFDPATALDIDLTSTDILDVDIHAAVLDALACADHTYGDRIALAHDTVGALRACGVPVVALTPSHPHLGLPAQIRPDVESVPVGAQPAARRAAVANALQRRRGPAPDPVPARRIDPGRWTVQLPGTPWGQIAARHVRPAGHTDARPLVLLHASPLSGESLLPLGRALADAGREVIVLDTLGNGDSDKPDPDRFPQFLQPEITDLARVALAALEAMGVGTVDVFGTHTGAVIAMEMAIADPARVQSLVVDGLPLLGGQDVQDLLTDYFVDLSPRWDGTHLAVAWSNVVDVLTWYPWHARDPGHRRAVPPVDLGALHRRAVQMLKSGPSYVVPHTAVARHATAARLPLLRVPTAFCQAPADPMAAYVDRCIATVPDGQTLDLAADPVTDAARIDAWLSGARPRSDVP